MGARLAGPAWTLLALGALALAPAAAMPPADALLAELDACLAGASVTPDTTAKPLEELCPAAARRIESGPWGPTLIQDLTIPLTLGHAREIRHLSAPFARGEPAYPPPAAPALDAIVAGLGFRQAEPATAPTPWERLWNWLGELLPDFSWPRLGGPGEWPRALAGSPLVLPALVLLLLAALAWRYRRRWPGLFGNPAPVLQDGRPDRAAHGPGDVVRGLFARVTEQLARRGLLARHAALTPREIVATTSGRLDGNASDEAALGRLAAAAEHATFAGREPLPAEADDVAREGAALLQRLAPPGGGPRG